MEELRLRSENQKAKQQGYFNKYSAKELNSLAKRFERMETKDYVLWSDMALDKAKQEGYSTRETLEAKLY